MSNPFIQANRFTPKMTCFQKVHRIQISHLHNCSQIACSLSDPFSNQALPDNYPIEENEFASGGNLPACLDCDNCPVSPLTFCLIQCRVGSLQDHFPTIAMIWESGDPYR